MRLAIGVVLALASAYPAAAQSLEDRVASAQGRVAFEFAVHGNVCGDGHGIFISDDTTPGWNHRSRASGMHFRTGSDGEQPCDIAPGRAEVEHDGRRVLSIRISVGGSPRSVDSELGRVPATDAARFLLAAAPRLEGRSANDAVLGASIADGPKVWPRLLEIARDNDASEASQKAALFWLSHEAAAAAVEGLGRIAEDDDAAASLRSDALFYLAQRKDGAGVDALIRIVRQSKSAKIRRDALWFLGQSRDPRSLALFAELLAGR
jgi:hypothetical protein